MTNSERGREWLKQRFEAAGSKYGPVPQGCVQCPIDAPGASWVLDRDDVEALGQLLAVVEAAMRYRDLLTRLGLSHEKGTSNEVTLEHVRMAKQDMFREIDALDAKEAT